MDTNQRKHTNPRPSDRRKPAQSRRRTSAKVVYTEAKPFNRNRFILQLVTVVAVVLALLFFAVLILVRHKANLARMRRREENKVSWI